MEWHKWHRAGQSSGQRGLHGSVRQASNPFTLQPFCMGSRALGGVREEG